MSAGGSLVVWLHVRESARALAFYQAAFGAVEVYHLDGPDGSLVCRLAVEGGEFWLSDEAPDSQNFSPQSLGGASARLIWTVSDPQAAVARAVAAGAREVYPVMEEHGWLLGRIVDPFGHHWEIGRELAR